jgi:hypothetical protein
VLVNTGPFPSTQPQIALKLVCCDDKWVYGTACPDSAEGGAGGVSAASGGPSVLNGCFDVGWGLASDGTLKEARSATDAVVFSGAKPGQGVPKGEPACHVFDWWHCHLGSPIVGTSNAAATALGVGGTIVPGAYQLVSISADGGQDGEQLVGVHISQTLYFTDTAVLFESDDDHRFSFTGSYSFTVKDAVLQLVPQCESQQAQYRQWSLNLGYTAAPKQLTLFSKELDYTAVYELVNE